MEGLGFGMSETNINISKRVAFNNVVIDVDDKCRICFETLADERTPVKLRCGHQYHLHCIGSWFNVKNIMLCPTCKQVEQGEWLFARSSPPSPNFNVPLVQPLIGRSPELVLRIESALASIRRQISLTLNDPPARSTSSVARRQMMLQQQRAADFRRTLAEQRRNNMYGFDIGSSSGEGGSYNHGGRRSSIGGGSSAQRMGTTPREKTRVPDQSQAVPLPLPPRVGPVATNPSQALPLSLPPRAGPVATANSGETSSSSGSKQFRPMNMRNMD